MSQTATDALVRRFFDALAQGEADAFDGLLVDDVAHDVNQGGERRIGRDRFKAYLARMKHHYDEDISDLMLLVSDDGARAAAEYNVAGVYKETEEGLPPAVGQCYQVPNAMFFAISDGRIARITHYYNLTEWLTEISRGLRDGG